MVRFVTPKEYAELMGIHEKTVRRLCNDGQVSCQKVGGRWRIAIDDEQPQKPSADMELAQMARRLADRQQREADELRRFADEIERREAA